MATHSDKNPGGLGGLVGTALIVGLAAIFLPGWLKRQHERWHAEMGERPTPLPPAPYPEREPPTRV